MNALALMLVLSAPFPEEHVVKFEPEGMNDKAVLKGRAPWCTDTFEGEAGWSQDRVYRSVKANRPVELDYHWHETAFQLCAFPDDPTWRANAQALLQVVMNSQSLTQTQAEAWILKRLEKFKKDKANEGKEPSDEEKFGFPEKDFTPIAAAPGVDTAKPGKMSWCEGFKPAKQWQTHEFRYAVEYKYGVNGPVTAAAQLCSRPDDASWQKEGAFVLQKWMNFTGQSAEDASKSFAARIREETWKAERQAYCESIELNGEITGGDRAFALMQRQVLGCENDNQPLWQVNRSPANVAYYLDPNTDPPSELIRVGYMIGATSDFDDEKPDVVSYAAAQRDFAALDVAKLDAEMSKDAAFNSYARTVLNETVSTLKQRQRLFEPAIEKLCKDPDYADVLRKAPARGWERWEKTTSQWKPELARSNAFEKKMFGASLKVLKGCTAELRPDVQKLIKSYKLKDYRELRARIASDPLAMILMNRLSVCTAFEKVQGLSGVLKDLVQGGREFRGPRSMAFFEMQDAITEVKKDRLKFPLNMTAYGYNQAPVEPMSGDFSTTGGIGYDIERAGPRGVVGSVTKGKDGVEVKFKHSSITYPEQTCRNDTSHPFKISADGTILYYQLCKYTGKMLTEDTTPSPITVSAQLAETVKPGVFVQADDAMHVIHFTKKSAKEKNIESFYGFDL